MLCLSDIRIVVKTFLVFTRKGLWKETAGCQTATTKQFGQVRIRRVYDYDYETGYTYELEMPNRNLKFVWQDLLQAICEIKNNRWVECYKYGNGNFEDIPFIPNKSSEINEILIKNESFRQMPVELIKLISDFTENNNES
jgi:hypothetical protein